VSGKRPVEGCSGAIQETEDGGYVSASSVYTEYFVKGTQPGEYCDIHTAQSINSRVAAGWMGSSPTVPTQQRAEVAGGTTEEREEARDADRSDEQQSEAPEVSPEPKKKRGFWAKVFGVGDDDQQKNETKDKKKEPEKKQ
jgi:hypothetical protein